MDSSRIVKVRDVGDCSIPHLDANRFRAFSRSPDQQTREDRVVIELSDMLIGELKAADIVVIGAPMYNLTIPSGLKAYIDHIARPGQTFRYTASGPIGLLAGRKAVVVSAAGGIYEKTQDLVRSYFPQILGLFGITDIDFIHAEGLAISEEARSRGLKSAEQQMLALLDRIPVSKKSLENRHG